MYLCHCCKNYNFNICNLTCKRIKRQFPKISQSINIIIEITVKIIKIETLNFKII